MQKIHKRRLIIMVVIAIVFIGLFLSVGIQGNLAYALSKRSERLFAIILSGSSIAIATVLFQSVVHNRVLTPNVLGLDALYMLFQTALVFLFGSIQLQSIPKEIHFIMSLCLMVAFSGTLFRVLFRENRQIYVLLLVGLVIGTFFQSLTSFMQLMLDPNEYLIIQDKSFASFTNIESDVFGLALIAFGIAIVLMRTVWRKVDVVSLGQAHATNLGVNYEKTVRRILLVVIILTALSTALVGPLTFLGLLVVNVTYQLFATYRHQILLPAAVLISIIVLIGGQFIIEHVFEFGAPLTVIINLVGGSYFMYLLWKGNEQG